MAPPKRPWLRWYVEAVTDPKLRRLSAEERWMWVVVLSAARQSPVPGWLLVTETLPMEHDDLAELAGMTPARVEKGMAKMVDLGIVTFDGSSYRVTKWDERQFESDNVGKRTAKHRSKNVEAPTMERCNDVDVTPPESEADSETDPSSSSVTTSGLVDPVLEDDERILNRLVALKLAARQARRDLEPIVDLDAWCRTARQREMDGDFIARCDQAVLDMGSAEFPDHDAIARFLFDGTKPPAPPKVYRCSECDTELVGLDAYQSHPDVCEPLNAVPEVS